jgi:hypothetical protein
VGIAVGANPSFTQLVELMGTVMPGETVRTRDPVAVDLAANIFYLMFRDSAGISWVRWPDGSLKQSPSESPWARRAGTAPQVGA